MKQQRVIFALLLTWAVSTARCATAPATAPKPPVDETYLGVYLANQKIGYTSTLTRPATYKGKPAFVIESVNLIRANILGQKLEETIFTKQVSDAKWAPLQLIFTQKSGGRTSSLVADFFADRVECKQVTAQRTTLKTVEIPQGVNLIADHQVLAAKKSFKPGELLRFHEFNPALLTIDKNEMRALKSEEITLQGAKHKAMVVEHTAYMGGAAIKTTMWLDREGEPLKMASLLGLTFIREPKAVAMKFPGGDEKPIDIAFATSLRTDKVIENPRQTKYLKLSLADADGLKTIPQEARQKLTLTGGGGKLEVSAQEFEATKSALLPIREHGEFLKDGPYVEASEAAIEQQAAEIIGDEKNAYRAAVKLRDWVHKRIHWQANIGVMRSAVDILKDPAGVCRDAAVLFTALARAGGIPTRIAAGLAYAATPEPGFFGHAWAEVFVGEWVPLDPTLGETPFVDATHIKLAQGEYTCFFEVVLGMEKMKVEILEFR